MKRFPNQDWRSVRFGGHGAAPASGPAKAATLKVRQQMDPVPIIWFVWLIMSFFGGLVGWYVDWRCHPNHHGSVEGFFHGALLGPFGWILLALYPPDQPDDAGDTSDAIKPADKT
jgi:hypothetical protein